MRFSARALRAECFDYDQNKNCFYYTVGHFYNNKNAFKIVCCGWFVNYKNKWLSHPHPIQKKNEIDEILDRIF